MSVTQYSKIQHRRGLLQDLPVLNTSELGHAIDQGRLFIGNGLITDGAVQPGNTEIITDTSMLYNPRALKYVYQSNTPIIATTGATSTTPTVRSIGEILDDYVSVKSYGAIGDGVADDTLAINRALQDLYCQLQPTPTAQEVSRRQLFFPAGVYKLTAEVFVPPYASLIGEGKSKTIIKQTFSGAPAVIRTADSLYQIDIQMGNNSATLPTDLFFSGITFQYAPTDIVGLDGNIVQLERTNNVYFENCSFVGNWVGDIFGTRAAIVLSALGTVFVPSNIRAIGCSFFNNAQVVNMDEAPGSTQVYFDFADIHMSLYGINTASQVFDVKVSNSSFIDITRNAILAHRLSSLVSSINNTFTNCGTIASAAILFDGLVNDKTQSCSSIGDKFINCPTPITNLGFNSTILDSQGNFVFQTLTTTPLQSALTLAAGSGVSGFDLNDNTGTINLTLNNTVFIDYTIRRGQARRIGRLYIFSDGTTQGTIFSDLYSETTDTFIDFGFTIAGNLLSITYTSSGSGPAQWNTQAKAFLTPLS